MDQLTRRLFLERLSLTVGTLALHQEHVSATPLEPHIPFPTTPRERVAIPSYPFRAYIESPVNRDRNPAVPGMDLAQFASEVASKFGVHNIEPHSRHFSSLDSAYLEQFRDGLAKVHAKVVNIAVSVEASFYDADLQARKKAVASREEMGRRCHLHRFAQHSRPYSSGVELGSESSAHSGHAARGDQLRHGQKHHRESRKR